MTERKFIISYFSEVTALVTVGHKSGTVYGEATHPMDDVSIECWFHFQHTTKSSPASEVVSVKEQVSDHDSERKAILTVLDRLADELYPGVEALLQRDDSVENLRERFYTDFMYAFITGCVDPKANISLNRPLSERFKCMASQ